MIMGKQQKKKNLIPRNLAWVLPLPIYPIINITITKYIKLKKKLKLVGKI
jgi:hypothetical protein